MNGDVVRIAFTARPDYILAVRLAVSAVAERLGFDIEDIEDLKVASAEGCILLLSYRPETVSVSLTARPDGLEVDILGEAPKGRVEEPEEDLSQYLLEAIVDTCSFEQSGDIVTGVHFFKKAAARQ